MSTYAGKPPMRIVSLVANAVPAILATALLVLLMHSLIATDMSPPEIQDRPTFEVILEVPEIREAPPRELPKKPQEIASAPERLVPQLVTDDAGLGGILDSHDLPPVATQGPISTGTNMVVPYMRLQPKYPARALERGIEGYVDLAFDITAAGATSNIRVIAAQPEGIFERAAIRALERWKYRVPVTDGTPQGQDDMMTRLSFEIDD